MKKITIIVIVVLLSIILTLTSIFVIVPVLKSQSDENGEEDSNLNQDNSILNCMNKDDVEKYISQQSYGEHSFYYGEDGYYYFSNEPVLNSDAEIEIFLYDNQIETLVAMIEVFYAEASSNDYVDENDENIGGISEINPQEYIFDDDEKGQIEQTFNSIKKSFECFFNCGEFKTCDYVPAHIPEGGEKVSEDNDENFYRGFVIREYSLRDSDGILWLLRFEASNGSASASILKIIDETGYEGFLPIIDMTQDI